MRVTRMIFTIFVGLLIAYQLISYFYVYQTVLHIFLESQTDRAKCLYLQRL